ncbi:Guanine nucleotide exchange factor subunit Rich [Madurella mycetomatis]|uniref:Guanine nucleotide exchange factor subunit Rich n=1 Tax=Madurella mycetomatis TaxID=100816 RepID=A0A175VTW6_9PEZI|nr:Guanine nucleotide exchange factor subunit Rich [Madurella mycetomatis]KXX74303.1 Guanine nucleotide exchange factor subunit Rich [Madurella mycetomatis]
MSDDAYNGKHSDGQQRPQKRRRLSNGAGSSTATSPPPVAESPTLTPQLPTHDISHVPDHISSIQQVAKQIEVAAREAWDRRFRYKDAFVMLLNWEDDDLDVAPEVANLEATFRDVYHYKTEIWKIPTKKPDWDIKERLIRFLKNNDADGNLVIFYYAGHAMPNPQSGGAPLWSSFVAFPSL